MLQLFLAYHFWKLFYHYLLFFPQFHKVHANADFACMFTENWKNSYCDTFAGRDSSVDNPDQSKQSCVATFLITQRLWNIFVFLWNSIMVPCTCISRCMTGQFFSEVRRCKDINLRKNYKTPCSMLAINMPK